MYVILNHLYRYFMSWSIPIKKSEEFSFNLITMYLYMQTIVNAVVHFSVQKNISKILFIFCLISDDKNLKS